jgi:hypothetical protein
MLLVILIFLDFIYLLPTYALGLAINFIITLIWYFPTIYQLYSFIFMAKEYYLRIRIYLLLFSPIVIISYIPYFLIYSIGYCIFISLINPLIAIIRRPEYPLYPLSSTAAIAHIIYNYECEYSIEELLISTIFSVRIKEVRYLQFRSLHKT